ncbi:MAG: cell division protein SepF [Firmicutes bacterium]|jgi:cell division inhibitor SepF|nr:cell division protein SepF [Bacillota bacterium]
MRRGFIDRLLDFMGFGEVPDDTCEFAEGTILRSDGGLRAGAGASRRGRGLVALPQSPRARLVVTEPGSFDDIPGILEHLKKRRPVIVRISDIDRELARRVLDFAGGATYALNGSMQKVSEGVFLFTPSNFEIGLDLPEGVEQGAKPLSPFFDKR